MKSDTRNRLLLPLLLPLGILGVLAVVLFGFSRVLLAVAPHAATAVAVVVAATILAGAAFAASRPRVRTATIGALVGGVAGVAMVAGGIAVVAFAPKAEGRSAVTVAIAAPSGASVSGFDKKILAFPADTPVKLVFTNDDNTTHNVVIFNGPDANAPQLFRGQPVNGGQSFPYNVQPLSAGSYFFHCEFHPTAMTGTLTVSKAARGITVTAQNIAFDTNTITLPAGQATKITFVNKDAGIQHNIGIYDKQGSTNELFKGPLVTGPNSTTYDVKALPPGTYYFQCDIHPTQMNGTVTVAAPPSPSPSVSSPSPTPGKKPKPSPTGGGKGQATASIQAVAVQTFSTTTLTFPAKKTIAFTFDNQEVGVQHTFTLYADSAYTQQLATTDPITGPAQATISIGPLQPGTYYFRCQVHPTVMFGTVTVP